MISRNCCDSGGLLFYRQNTLEFSLIDYIHMVSIRVSYGFRWHSDKPNRTPLRLDMVCQNFI